MLQFNRAGVLKRLQKKRIVSVELNDRPSLVSTDYTLYRRSGFVLAEMGRLQFTHDTSEVLEIYFGDESTYGDFVWAFNNAVVFRFHRYVYLDNSLYFWADPAPPRVPEQLELLVPQPDNIFLQQMPPRKEPTQLELLWKSIRWEWAGVVKAVRYNYLLTAGVMALILIPGVWWIIRLWR